MKPSVKFCGMTRSADIERAEAFSVDFIGFIFAASSPRSVTLDEAKKLRRSVQKAKTVGVFTDHTIDQIEKHAYELALDFIQLHGEPDLEKAKRVSKPVIQAFRHVPEEKTLRMFLACCAYVLIDGADIAEVSALPSDIRSRLFLAGGLTPENVRQAFEQVQPFAVDVARGIESQPGIKDEHLMNAFFQSLS
jgi:phosphoribosylanthranilate isomerase